MRMNTKICVLAAALLSTAADPGLGRRILQSSGGSYSMVESAGIATLILQRTGDRQTNASIPWSEIGAKAGADYKGDGLSVTPTDSGAQLHCVFQRLEGEATSEGLWLTST